MSESDLEQDVLDLIISTLEKKKQISIQNLSGYFSQLPNPVRMKLNLNKYEVKKLLLKSKMFYVDDDDVVHLKNEKSESNFSNHILTCSDDDSEDMNTLNNVKGKIIKLNNFFGFIELSESPLVTAYFDLNCFENFSGSDLNRIAKVGDDVIFTAKKTDGHKAKYRALRVRKDKSCSSSLSQCTSTSSIVSASSQESDRNEITNGVGIIIKLAETYGFLRNLNRKNKIFFHKDKVVDLNDKHINILSDFFKIDDIVYFNAIPSSKKTKEFLYEATKVWTTPSENLNEKENKSSSESIASVQEHTMFFSDEDDDNAKDDTCNETGKIYFSGAKNCIAKIKFGNKQEAIVLPEIPFYKNGEIKDLAWELDEGDDVNFIAESQSDDTVLKVLLIWIGSKPEAYNQKKDSKGTHTKYSTNKTFPFGSIDKYNADWSSSEINTSDNAFKNKTSNDGTQKISPNNSFKIKLNPKSSYASKLNKSYVSAKHFTKNTKSENYNSNVSDYKRINGWDEDEFNAETEEWPDLHCKIESEQEKTTKEKSEHKNETKNVFKKNNDVRQNKIQNKTELFRKNNNQEESFKDDIPIDNSEYENADIDENPTKEIDKKFSYSSDSANDNSEVDKSQLLNDCFVETFKNMTGTIKNLTKEYAFISSNVLTEEKPFSWENAYYDGLCVSKNFCGLKEIFEEFEQLNFNYLRTIDEDGNIWEKITLVWKGNKPENFTELTSREFLELLDISGLQITKQFYTEESTDKDSISTYHIPKIITDDDKKSLSRHKNKNSLVSDDIESRELREVLTKAKLSKCTTDYNNCENEDKTSTLNIKINDTGKFELINTIKEVTNALLLSPSPTQTCTINNSIINHKRENYENIVDTKEKPMYNKRLQTETKMCDKGTQTFITGKVLSFEIFPC